MTNEPQDVDFQATVISELADIREYFDVIAKALVSIQDNINELLKTNQKICKRMSL
ncbi:MAG: hypothetical protein WCR46_06860 [Deltaproteobacteria bacterium]